MGTAPGSGAQWIHCAPNCPLLPLKSELILQVHFRMCSNPATGRTVGSSSGCWLASRQCLRGTHWLWVPKVGAHSLAGSHASRSCKSSSGWVDDLGHFVDAGDGEPAGGPVTERSGRLITSHRLTGRCVRVSVAAWMLVDIEKDSPTHHPRQRVGSWTCNLHFWPLTRRCWRAPESRARRWPSKCRRSCRPPRSCAATAGIGRDETGPCRWPGPVGKAACRWEAIQAPRHNQRMHFPLEPGGTHLHFAEACLAECCARRAADGPQLLLVLLGNVGDVPHDHVPLEGCEMVGREGRSGGQGGGQLGRGGGGR